jgi:hypothetical protein
MVTTKKKAAKPEVGGGVLPVTQEVKINVLTSISFDKNGNLYGVVDGVLQRYDFDTKTWRFA